MDPIKQLESETQQKDKLILQSENMAQLLYQAMKKEWKQMNDQAFTEIDKILTSYRSILHNFRDELLKHVKQVRNVNDIDEIHSKRLRFLENTVKQIQTHSQSFYEEFIKKETSDEDEAILLNYVPRWPFAIHVISVGICMGLSAIFHLFSIKNQYLYWLLNKLDISGICILIYGTTYPLLMYGFACKETFVARNIFLIIISVSVAFQMVFQFHPKYMLGSWRGVRLMGFVLLSASALTPLLYACLQPTEKQIYFSKFRIMDYVGGGLVYLAGGILYARKFPEKYYPKTFDIIGSSHQLFHICVVIGAYIQFNGSFYIYMNRFDKVCPISIK